jgi:hypothetical protein
MHKTLIPVPAEVIDGFAANEHYKRMIFKNFFVHGVDFRGLQAGPPENRLAFFTDLSTSASRRCVKTLTGAAKPHPVPLC